MDDFPRTVVANFKFADLAEEQWGGRPGRTVIDLYTRKMPVFECNRVVHVTIALFQMIQLHTLTAWSLVCSQLYGSIVLHHIS